MAKPATLEPRHDCPVCTGLPMQKLQIRRKTGDIFLTLDCCRRCGGVWFDKDEVPLSQQITSPQIQQRITQQAKPRQSHCHQCNAPMDRNLERCPTCGWHNRIPCPTCHKPLKRQQHRQLTLDVCHSCQGVWFDQVELLALWNATLTGFHSHSKTAVNNNSERNYYSSNNRVIQAMGEGIVDVGLNGLIDASGIVEVGAQAMSQGAQSGAKAIAKMPEVAQGTTEALADVAGAALNTVGEVPEMVTVVLEVTGEIAGGMVEVLADVIGGLFS